MNTTQTFEKLAEPLRDELYRAAMGYTRNDADAEDMVQEAYLRAYRFFGRFESGTNFRAWMHTILRNVFLSSLRKARNQPTAVQLDTLSLMDQGALTEDSAEEHDEREAVHEAIDELPRDYGKVVRLSYLAGMKFREIADLLRWPIGTVMSRAARARVILKRTLNSAAA